MQRDEFKRWMMSPVGGHLTEGDANSRASNCSRVESAENCDLDTEYEYNRCEGLLAKLSYTRADKKKGKAPRHHIPINGDLVTGTDALKKAVRTYVKFRDANAASFSKIRPPVPDISENVDFRYDSSSWDDEDRELRAFLEGEGLARKAIDSRVRLASKVREILGCTLEDATRTDFEMAASLRVLAASPKEHRGNLQNVLRKFYKLVHGREFPRSVQEHDGALRISGRYKWNEVVRIFKELGICIEKPKDQTEVSSVLGRSGLMSCVGGASRDEKIFGFYFFSGSYDIAKDEYSLVRDFIPIQEPSLIKRLEELIKKSDMERFTIYNSAKIAKQYFGDIMKGKSKPSKLTLMRLILAMSLTWKDAVGLLSVAQYPLNFEYCNVDRAFKYCHEKRIRDPRAIREIFKKAGVEEYSLQGPCGDEEGRIWKKRRPLKIRTAEEARREAERLDAMRLKRQVP